MAIVTAQGLLLEDRRYGRLADDEIAVAADLTTFGDDRGRRRRCQRLRENGKRRLDTPVVGKHGGGCGAVLGEAGIVGATGDLRTVGGGHQRDPRNRCPSEVPCSEAAGKGGTATCDAGKECDV